MSDTPQRPGWRRYLPRLLLLIPLAAVLWVPSYNKIEPQLGGVPFFYWYQLAWILLGALCVLIVHVLEMRIGRRA
jgi:hypothetical protein